MTKRTDLQRIFAFLAVLGTEGEAKGYLAWDAMAGWKPGPQPAPSSGVRGGGGSETQAEDRRAEAAQARSAAKRFEEFRAHLAALEKYAREVMRDIDIACPPDLEELKSRRTGTYEADTAADVAADGWCASCWRNDQQMVRREKDRRDMYFYKSYCRWCGLFKAKHGIEPPLPLLEARHAGHSISLEEVEKAIKAATPKGKKKTKGRRKKAA